METHASSLLSLPNAVLHEVISWSPNSATARALVSLCRVVHQQCQDPAASALLLIRCTIGSAERSTSRAGAEELQNILIRKYMAALASCTACHGGTAAVVQQLLHLVQASPETGGPMAAPAALLQAALCDAASDGDVHTVRALMALPRPPDVNAGYGQAAQSAMDPERGAEAGPQLAALGAFPNLRQRRVPHLAALQALLEYGADPAATCETFCRGRISRPDDVPALLMLLHACPAERLGDATTAALRAAAVHTPDSRALGRLLKGAPAAADTQWDRLLSLAAADGRTAAVGLLLNHRACSAGMLTCCLQQAAAHRRVECAALLLDRGAAFWGGGDVEMEIAIRDKDCFFVGDGTHPKLRSMLVLLLQHGATMTLRVSKAAERHRCTDVLTAALKEVAAATKRKPESLCKWCGTWCRERCWSWRTYRYSSCVGDTLSHRGMALCTWWSGCIE